MAGDDVGLIIRQSLNESGRGDLTRSKDLSLLRKRIEDLEVQLERQKKIEKVQENCETLIRAAKRLVEYRQESLRGDSNAVGLKGVENEALNELLGAVLGIYEGDDIKKVEPVKGVKRRKIQK